MAVPVELCPSLHPELDISLAGRTQSCFSCCNFQRASLSAGGWHRPCGEPKGLQEHGGCSEPSRMETPVLGRF